MLQKGVFNKCDVSTVVLVFIPLKTKVEISQFIKLKHKRAQVDRTATVDKQYKYQ